MMNVTEAWRVIDTAITPVAATGRDLTSAANRTLASPLMAPMDDPPFTRSAMDGFLLPIDAKPGVYTIQRELRPGIPPPKKPPQSGEAWKVFTGSALPESGCGVVIVEDTKVLDPDTIQTRAAPSTSWIRPRGSHRLKGETLLPAGTTLTPGALALAASFGIPRVRVFPAPKVAHITTGSEIVPLGSRPRRGQITDSNAPLVAAMVAESHAQLVSHARTDESHQALVEAIASALEHRANVVLISGGASVGDHDHTRAALERSGFAIRFHSINCRPGRPLIFATRGRTVAFGLPGNPLSHFVCFRLFVERALRRLDGRNPNEPTRVSVAPPHPPRNARETWWPSETSVANASLVARLLPWRDSSDLTGLATANSLVRVPADQPPADAILWAPPRA